MIEYNTYSYLLQDDLFLRWRLFPTKELDKYWSKEIEKYPELSKEIDTADRYLKEKYFKVQKLTNTEKDNIIKDINHSLKNNTKPIQKKVSITSWFKYVAIFIILISTTLILSILLQNTTNLDTTIEDSIVGNINEDSDIQLLIGDETITYNQNIDLVLNDEGEISIDNKVINKYNKENEHTTNRIVIPHGKRSKILLSDNSTLWLNSGTIIEFPSIFSKQSRDITIIKGECFIEVTPDSSRPFFVNTNKMKVMVHGTKFNVSAYKEEEQSVVLLEGSVSIETKDNTKPFFVKPNEQAILSKDNNISINKVDTDLLTSWHNGYLLFSNTSITDALKQIERYYNLSFDYNSSKGIKDIKCNGKLILSDNIDNVLKTISIITSTEYSIENNKILITNKKTQINN